MKPIVAELADKVTIVEEARYPALPEGLNEGIHVKL